MFNASNAPLQVPPRFAQGTIAGITEPGWTVELYDGGTLSNVVEADSAGRYSIPVDWVFGGRRLQFVEISRNGERRVRDYRYMIPTQMSIPGELTYDIAGELDVGESGVDRSSTRFLTGVAETKYGVSPWLTLTSRTILDRTDFDHLGFASLDADIAARLWPGGMAAIEAGVDIRRGLIRAAYSDAPCDGLQYSLNLERYAPSTGQVSASAAVGASMGRVSSYVAARMRRDARGTYADGVAYIAVPMSSLSLGLSCRVRAESASETTGEIRWPGDMRILPPESAITATCSPTRTSVLRARAAFQGLNSVPQSIDVDQTFILGRLMRVTLGCEVDSLDWNGSTVFAQLSLDLPVGRMDASAVRRSDDITLSSHLAGSALVGTTGISVTSGSSVGFTALRVFGYYDANSNGRFDDGDTSLGSLNATLERNGYRMGEPNSEFTGLISGVPYVLDVDKWSHAGQGMFPSRQRLAVYTLPSAVQNVWVPFAQGFDVSGSVELILPNDTRRSSVSVFNGLRISLVCDQTGARYDGEVFQDGSLLVMGVGAGRYRIEFDDVQLQSRRIALAAQPPITAIDGNQTRLPAISFEPLRQVTN